MSFNINTVTISGGLAADPSERIKKAQSGTYHGKVPVGFSTSKKNADGSWEDVSNFIEVQVFGKMAEYLLRFGAKGTPVSVEGELRQERWQAQDGSNRSAIVLYARRFNCYSRPQENASAVVMEERSQGGGDFPADVPF